jgi:dTDP-glucose 4,6-dehydratase
MSATWLVTGGLGFIGSHFIRMVLRERPDSTVVNLDAMTYAANPANLASVATHERYRFVRGNICDDADVARAFEYEPDAIVNFAAETHVDRSIADSRAFVGTDVLGTHVLLEAARRARLPRFVQVSTDEVYGEIADGGSRETDRLAPRSPYAASKAGADHLVLAYAATYGLGACITRGSNTFGPNQYPEKFVPLAITNSLAGEDVPIYGDGSNVRDWMHAEDHARGILHVLERGDDGEIYNVGSDTPLPNRHLAERIARACGRDPERSLRYVADRPGHVRRHAVDATKLRALGWAPRHTFETALDATLRWYRENEAWWRPIKSGDFADYYRQQYATRAAP